VSAVKSAGEVDMRKAVRIALGSAVLATGFAIAGAAPASAQIRFEGSFPSPDGRISVGVAGPRFAVGTYVPEGYVVYDDPDYGYGFTYEDQWIRCEPYGSRFVIVEGPRFFGRRDYRSLRPFRSYAYGFERGDGRDRRAFDGRRFARDDRQFRDNRRPSFRDNRSDARGGRSFRDNRGGGRRGRDSRGWNRPSR
jgi:hypothetical protein